MTARVGGLLVQVGSAKILGKQVPAVAARLEAEGKSLLFVLVEGKLAAVLAARDTLRADVPTAIAQLRQLGIGKIELLTGVNPRTPAAVAQVLGISYRADMLPEDKIAAVKAYQAQGKVVVMIGDGVNDAPALAQADVGIAMGVAGSPVALDAAHIGLMREDWTLVPEVVRIARRTMTAVKINIGFTAVYNLTGLSLASAGLLPPAIAAAAQAGPDFGILANSARLLRTRKRSGGATDAMIEATTSASAQHPLQISKARQPGLAIHNDINGVKP